MSLVYYLAAATLSLSNCLWTFAPVFTRNERNKYRYLLSKEMWISFSVYDKLEFEYRRLVRMRIEPNGNIVPRCMKYGQRLKLV